MQAASSLSRLDDEITMRVCANVFCMLSAANSKGRKMLVERKSTLSDIFGLMRSHDRTTQVTCGKCACNLLSFPDSQAAAVQAGAVPVLQTICTLGDPESEKDCADAFFLISGSEKFRNEIVKSRVLPVLIMLSRSPNSATRWSCNRIILNLAWSASSREALLSTKAVPAMVALAKSESAIMTAPGGAPDKFAGAEITEMVAHTLAYLSLNEAYSVQMALDGVVTAVNLIYEAYGSKGAMETRICALAALTMRALASEPDALDPMVEQKAVPLLVKVASDAVTTGASPSVFAHCSTALYHLASVRKFHALLVEQGALDALAILGKHKNCYALVAATCYLLSVTPANREAIADHASVPSILIALAEAEREPDYVSTVTNCAQCFFKLSKATGKREKLVEAGVVTQLIRLSKSPLEKVSTNCSEALKNLSSNGEGGIEEGTVATLIQMSLSGTSAAAAFLDEDAVDEALIPKSSLPPIVEADFTPKEALIPQNRIAEFEPHNITFMKMVGGVAGQGPSPPEPPEMDTQDVVDINVDATDEGEYEEEGNMEKIMMFAKMEVPETILMESQSILEEETGTGGDSLASGDMSVQSR